MSGRKRKPIELLQAEGKTHLTKAEIEARKESESTLQPNADAIECPSWLTDEVAIEEYHRLSKELAELKLLTNLDVTTLASYCIAYANYLKATEELHGQPLVIESTNKSGFTNLIQNPLILIQLKYSDEMKKHASELGLTINSRLKMVVPPKPEKKKSKFEEFK